MNVQPLTLDGKDFVVLSRADYESLLDTHDIAAADKVLADVASGADEFVPAEVVNALIDGENPVRVWRSHRRLSARDLAERAGVSAAYISEIETGKKDGSISVMKKIAEVLDVDLDDLV